MKDSTEGTHLYSAGKRSLTVYKAHVGDTLYRVGEKVEPMAGFRIMKPMVRCPHIRYDLIKRFLGLRWCLSCGLERFPQARGVDQAG
jgi:hypothetical protein